MTLENAFKGWSGEFKTTLVNKLFLDKRYHAYDNVHIHAGRGFTQIDHVIVSKYGLFVVETKDKTGWIFGSQNQALWTQVIYRKKLRFKNPLIQNHYHTNRLSEYLHVEHDKLHSVVIFWGDCEFMTRMPDNVLKGYIFRGLRDYVKKKTAVLLSSEEIGRICSQLDTTQHGPAFPPGSSQGAATGGFTTKTRCPKCGADLIRMSLHKDQTSEVISVCGNFPRCRYTTSVIVSHPNSPVFPRTSASAIPSTTGRPSP